VAAQARWGSHAPAWGSRQGQGASWEQGQQQQQQQQQQGQLPDQPQGQQWRAPSNSTPSSQQPSPAQGFQLAAAAARWGSTTSLPAVPSSSGSAAPHPSRRPLHSVPLNTPANSGSSGQASPAFSKPKQRGTFASPAQNPAAGAAAAAATAAQGAYCFPPPSAAAPARRAAIPTSFSSPAQYLTAMHQAAAEEVELHVAEVARAFHQATASFRWVHPAASRSLGQQASVGTG
jgi:hypothetical protein